jgi:transcriptional regulator with GAF, ATPase, and Fis domain
MITVNCAAIPETLVESELFGHEKGAFTGVDRQKKEKFELADRVTIFLDEIGEMPLAAQAKILRVLLTGTEGINRKLLRMRHGASGEEDHERNKSSAKRNGVQETE